MDVRRASQGERIPEKTRTNAYGETANDLTRRHISWKCAKFIYTILSNNRMQNLEQLSVYGGFTVQIFGSLPFKVTTWISLLTDRCLYVIDVAQHKNIFEIFWENLRNFMIQIRKTLRRQSKLSGELGKHVLNASSCLKINWHLSHIVSIIICT